MNANAPNDKYARLKLGGEFVDIMCDGNPDHIPISGTKMERRCFI